MLAYFGMDRYPLRPKRSKPKRHNRESWVELEVGQPIRTRDGEATRWVLCSKPFRKSPAQGQRAWVEVLCSDCGTVYFRALGEILRGRSRGCLSCQPKRRAQARAEAATP